MRTLLITAMATSFATSAVAGQITLYNGSGSAVEVRAVRQGMVPLKDGEGKSFLYPAEAGDFRVWLQADRCEHAFPFEASEDAKLQLGPGPVLMRLPADATAADPAARQPDGWPLKPFEKICD